MANITDHGEYTEIVCEPNETYTKELSNGETWENVLIDIRANGAGYEVQANTDDWTIRNIGIRGGWDHEPPASPWRLAVTDPDNSCVCENIYLGEGAQFDWAPNQNPTGMYAYWYHAGTLTVRNVYVQNMSDNALYLSGPGNGSNHPNPGDGGEVHVEESYIVGNAVSGVRLGTDGSYAKKCVIEGGHHRGVWQYYETSEYIDCDIYNQGVSDVDVGGGAWDKQSTAEASMDNCYWESTDGGPINGSSLSSPHGWTPDALGVPTSAEEAARGGSSGDGSDTDHTWGEGFNVNSDHYLEPAGGNQTDSIALLDGTTVAAGHSYEVDLEIGPGATPDVGIAFGVPPDHDWAAFDSMSDYEGYFLLLGDDETRLDRWDNGDQARSTSDTAPPTGEPLRVTIGYRDDNKDITITVEGAESGHVTDLTLDDETVYDGGAIGIYHWEDQPFRVYSMADTEHGTSGGGSGSEADHTLTISGQGEPTNYYFETSGSITQNPEREDLESYDNIDGTTASGWVTQPEHTDSFQFDGELVDIGFEKGVATVELDGEEIDPSTYGSDDSSEPEAEHTLTISGKGEATNYYVETSGTLEQNPDRGDLQDYDTIDGTTASGWVTRPENVDGYQFNGELVEVRFDQGEATVELDGEEIDPTNYNGKDGLNHLLLFDGTAADGESTYEFEVTGDVMSSGYQDATVDIDDTIEGTSVTGTVDNGQDAYWFDGDIVDFRIAGHAEVDIQYNARSS